MIVVEVVVLIWQQPSASLIFAKSLEKVKDLLPSEFDASGSPLIDDEFYLGDEDDWKLPVEFSDDDDGQEAAELLRQRGLCINELDITASVTDIDWLVADESRTFIRLHTPSPGH